MNNLKLTSTCKITRKEQRVIEDGTHRLVKFKGAVQ